MRQSLQVIGLLWLCLCPTLLLAQTAECAAQMQTALWQLTTACAAMGRNTWCSLEQQADLNTLDSLNIAPEPYTVSRMQLQANVPDTLPDQQVTMLLLGGVRLQKLPGEIQPEIQITTNHAVNIRQNPSTNAGIITEMRAGQHLTAIGRNATGDWLLVILAPPNHTAEATTGWLYAPNVTPDGQIATLNITNVPPPERPMQVFQFATAPQTCADGSASGILLQTPPEAGWIDLQINGVALRLNATLFLQATIPGEMLVQVLEGVVKVTAADVPVDIPAGAELRIPLNAAGFPAAPPALLTAYSHETIAFLPVEHLPHLISTPPQLDTAALDQLHQANSPRPGVWLVKYDIPHVNCFNGQYILQYNTAEITLPLVTETFFFYETPLTRTGTGTYTGSRTYQIHSNNQPIGISTEVYTLRVQSPTYIEADINGIWSFTDAGNCPVNNRFKLVFLR